MNSQACPACGCVNWKTATNCIKCKTELFFNNPAVFNNEPAALINPPTNRQFEQVRLPENNQNYIPGGYPASFNNQGSNAGKIFAGAVFIFILGISVFVYAGYYKIDKVSGISAFDQYYNKITPPNETDLRNAITTAQSHERMEEVVHTTPTTRLNCTTTTGACWEQNEDTKTVRRESVLHTPELFSYEIVSSTLTKNSEGKITYAAKYKGMLKPEEEITKVKRNGVESQFVNTYLPVEGAISLDWNDDAKTWNSPAKAERNKTK